MVSLIQIQSQMPNTHGVPHMNNAFKIDPSRTATLRKQFEGKLYNRFRWLKGQINKSIIDNDCFGLKSPKPQDLDLFPIVNAPAQQHQFAFERDPKKVSEFMAWLQVQIDSGILELFQGQQIGDAIDSAWTNIYIQTAYQKGIIRARQELQSKGYEVPAPETTNILVAFNQPFHLDRVGLIYTRTYTGLKGITDEVSKQISMVLAQGIADGLGPNEVARKLNERVDKIGITRARTLARTEIIRAHHAATIQEYRNYGAVGVIVDAEWVTAGDGRVCEKCKSMARKDNGFGPGIYTLDQVESLIPAHPNCRCVCIPVDITDGREILKKDKKEKS